MTIDDIPILHRKLYVRALTGRNQAAAIRSNCLMCCGWQFDEVEACTAPSCPLYPYRRNGHKARTGRAKRENTNATAGGG